MRGRAATFTEQPFDGRELAIFVMERNHKQRLRKAFSSALGSKPIFVLDIPDEYERDQPKLIARLHERVRPLLATLENRNCDGDER